MVSRELANGHAGQALGTGMIRTVAQEPGVIPGLPGTSRSLLVMGVRFY
jgi:hypothetical protein